MHGPSFVLLIGISLLVYPLNPAAFKMIFAAGI